MPLVSAILVSIRVMSQKGIVQTLKEVFGITAAIPTICFKYAFIIISGSFL